MAVFFIDLLASMRSWVGELARKGKKNPAIPAAMRINAALTRYTLAVKAAAAMTKANHEESDRRPMDHEAFRMSPMTTGGSPAVRLCSAGMA